MGVRIGLSVILVFFIALGDTEEARKIRMYPRKKLMHLLPPHQNSSNPCSSARDGISVTGIRLYRPKTCLESPTSYSPSEASDPEIWTSIKDVCDGKPRCHFPDFDKLEYRCGRNGKMLVEKLDVIYECKSIVAAENFFNMTAGCAQVFKGYNMLAHTSEDIRSSRLCVIQGENVTTGQVNITYLDLGNEESSCGEIQVNSSDSSGEIYFTSCKQGKVKRTMTLCRENLKNGFSLKTSLVSGLIWVKFEATKNVHITCVALNESTDVSTHRATSACISESPATTEDKLKRRHRRKKRQGPTTNEPNSTEGSDNDADDGEMHQETVIAAAMSAVVIILVIIIVVLLYLIFFRGWVLLPRRQASKSLQQKNRSRQQDSDQERHSQQEWQQPLRHEYEEVDKNDFHKQGESSRFLLSNVQQSATGADETSNDTGNKTSTSKIADHYTEIPDDFLSSETSRRPPLSPKPTGASFHVLPAAQSLPRAEEPTNKSGTTPSQLSGSAHTFQCVEKSQTTTTAPGKSAKSWKAKLNSLFSSSKQSSVAAAPSPDFNRAEAMYSLATIDETTSRPIIKPEGIIYGITDLASSDGTRRATTLPAKETNTSKHAGARGGLYYVTNIATQEGVDLKHVAQRDGSYNRIGVSQSLPMNVSAPYHTMETVTGQYMHLNHQRDDKRVIGNIYDG